MQRFSTLFFCALMLSACGESDKDEVKQKATPRPTATTPYVKEPTTGGNPNQAPVIDPAVLAPVTVPKTADVYTLLGRYDNADPIRPRFAYPNSRIGIRFTGTQVAVSLSDTATDVWGISIDGTTLATTIVTTPSVKPVLYSLATNLPEGTHTLWLSKRTEANQDLTGSTQLYGFALTTKGELLTPPALPGRKIEFVGDSTFTGYGANQHVTKTGADCKYSPQTQNADTSVPQYTGDNLGAQIFNLSGSGQAVFNSFWDPNNSYNLLPTTYNEILPAAKNPAWDFTRWTADVVVISAGGGDLWGEFGVGQFPDRRGFIATYAQWLAEIRGHYPNALIVCIRSPSAALGDSTSLTQALQEAIAVRTSAGDNNVKFYDYFTGTPYGSYDDIGTGLGLAYGCNYHPSPAGAKWLADRLSTFIAAQKGW